MATFKIEVELDWIDSETNLDETLKEMIAAQVVKSVSDKAIKDIRVKIDSMICETLVEKINTKIDELLQDFLTRPRIITDQFGDPIKSDISVIDLLKQQCSNFMETPVDKQGKVPVGPDKFRHSEHKTRIDYIIDKNITNELERSINRAAERVKDSMQEYVNETLTTQIGERMAKLIGLENIKI